MPTNDLQAVQDIAAATNSRLRQFEPGNPLRAVLKQIARYWWVELVAGALWLVIALVILKFNHASVVTVGVITGLMFLLLAAEHFAIAGLVPQMRWVPALFGVLLTAAGIIALSHPVKTFASLADMLGFVFLLIGAIWTMQAFVERMFNDLWWLSLISGVMMVVLAFWVSGEFYLDRAATLLVFSGIWAAMKGVTDIVRAFQLRALGELV